MIPVEELPGLPCKHFNPQGSLGPVWDLRPGDILKCRDKTPYMNAWCRNPDAGYNTGCGKCTVMFLKYERSEPPYEGQVWGYISWSTWIPGRVDRICPNALTCFSLVFRVWGVPLVIDP